MQSSRGARHPASMNSRSGIENAISQKQTPGQSQAMISEFKQRHFDFGMVNNNSAQKPNPKQRRLSREIPPRSSNQQESDPDVNSLPTLDLNKFSSTNSVNNYSNASPFVLEKLHFSNSGISCANANQEPGHILSENLATSHNT